MTNINWQCPVTEAGPKSVQHTIMQVNHTLKVYNKDITKYGVKRSTDV